MNLVHLVKMYSPEEAHYRAGWSDRHPAFHPAHSHPPYPAHQHPRHNGYGRPMYGMEITDPSGITPMFSGKFMMLVTVMKLLEHTCHPYKFPSSSPS